MRKAAIFDLDFTFVNVNSTSDFVRFHLLVHRRFLKLLRYYSVILLANIGWFHFAGGSARESLIACLSGEARERLVEAARLYASRRLKKAVNGEMEERFHDLKGKGYYTIVVSSSLDCVVEACGELFGFDDWRSSELAYDRTDTCRGFLARDLTGKKEEALGDVDFGRSLFFTDNQEDLALMGKVKNSFGVVRRGFEERFWRQRAIPVVWVRPKVVFSRRLLCVPPLYFFNIRTNPRAFLFTYGGALILAFLFFKHSLTALDWWFLFLSWLGFAALHEIGYMVNDCRSVRREKTPSFRVDDLFCESLPLLVFARLPPFILIVSYFYFVGFPVFSIGMYLFGNLAVVSLFAVHNFIRQPRRVWTYPILTLSHFAVPLLLFDDINVLYPVTAAALFYVPWATVRYIRKVNGLEEMTERQELRLVVLPKAVVFLICAVLFYLKVLPFGVVVIGFLLSIIDFGRAVKSAVNRVV